MARPLKSGHQFDWGRSPFKGKCKLCAASISIVHAGPQKGQRYVIKRGAKAETVKNLSAAKKCVGKANKKAA